MFNITKLSFIDTLLGDNLNQPIHLYIKFYQRTLLSSYRDELYKGEVYKKAEGYIKKGVLEKESNDFINALVRKGENFSYITDALLSFSGISNLRKVAHKIFYIEIPDFSHIISEIFDIFITLRFDQEGNIRENSTFEQTVNIAKCIAFKVEYEWLHVELLGPSSINKYFISAADKAELPPEAAQFINKLKTGKSTDMANQFSIRDIITADIMLNLMLSKENQEKKSFYYKEFVAILAEVINLRGMNEEVENFFTTLSKYNLIKLLHCKGSFLKLVRSDKQFKLQQASKIVLELVDQHVLDSILDAKNRNDSNQEIESFIVEVSEIISNSTIGTYSQDEIDDFICKAQEINKIKSITSSNHVRYFEIFPVYYHYRPIFYHLLDKLILIDRPLSLSEIKKFIQVVALNTSEIINDDRFLATRFSSNDFRSRLFNKTESNFGTDYIIKYLLNNNVSLEEIGELFSGILSSYGYHSFHKLLYEEYQLLNTSVYLYCCMKDQISLSIKEFSLSFINQFSHKIDGFDHEFWRREYIPGIFSIPQALRSDAVIKILITLKSELRHCHSYRDIAKRIFSTQQQNGSKFWSELVKTARLGQLVSGDSAQQITRQILSDDSSDKVKSLTELSTNQWINCLLCSVLAKVTTKKKTEQLSSSLCDISVCKLQRNKCAEQESNVFEA